MGNDPQDMILCSNCGCPYFVLGGYKENDAMVVRSVECTNCGEKTEKEVKH
jgi:DNA-directed RNA polymerase subunit RPC12/RpoP